MTATSLPKELDQKTLYEILNETTNNSIKNKEAITLYEAVRRSVWNWLKQKRQMITDKGEGWMNLGDRLAIQTYLDELLGELEK